MSELGRVGEEGGGSDLVKLSIDLLEGHVGLVGTFCQQSIHGDRSSCCTHEITRFDFFVENNPPPPPPPPPPGAKKKKKKKLTKKNKKNIVGWN